MNRPIRILMVDDHPMLREGVCSLIRGQPDMEVAGEAATGQEALAKFMELKPDVTLMDLQMPGKDGIWAARQIREECPEARIIMLTTYEGDAHALSALKAGVAGYLLKSAVRKDLLETVRIVHSGKHRVEPSVAQDLALRAAQESLNEREIEILKLVSGGKANKDIGRILLLSEDTVKSYLKSAFSKLNVNDRTHAVTIAIKRGLIDI